MPWHESIAGYVEAVCRQVRWKKARPAIAAELAAHIEDQAAAYVAAGLDEDTARSKAVASMGDPVHTGTLLDASYRPELPWPVLFAFGGLVILGILGRALALGQPFDGVQALALLLALGGFFLFYNLDWRRLIQGTWLAYGAAVLLSLLLAKAQAWGSLGQLHTAASCLLLLFPLAFGLLIYRCRGKGAPHILFLGALFCLPGYLLLKAPAVPLLLVLAVSCLGLMTIAIFNGHFKTPKWKALLLVWAPTLTVLLLAPLTNFYWFDRLQGALHPQLDPQGDGYLPLVLRGCLAGARLFGQGALAGAAALEGQGMLCSGAFRTDYALTYCIHRYGWWVFLALLALLGWLFYRLFKACSRQTGMLGKLLGYGAALTLAAQFASYIVANLGFVVICNLPMPFLTSGNSALVVNAWLTGLLTSVMAGGSCLRDEAYRPGPVCRAPAFLAKFFQEEGGQAG